MSAPSTTRRRTAPMLSKSRYIAGRQCHLRLWYDCYSPELASEPDDATLARFEADHEVGAYARRRYPGGRLVEAEYWDRDGALAATAALLGGRRLPALYEAAFVHQGVFVRVDVLARATRGRWDLVEVKSSSTLKDAYFEDVAIQAWVLEGADLHLHRVGVLTLNRDYVHDGGTLDLDALFVFHDLTSRYRALRPELAANVAQLQKMLTRKRPPAIAPGAHCFEPYECACYAHCTRDLTFPAHPLDELPRLHASRRQQLVDLGVQSVAEIPADFPLNPLQARVRDCVQRGTHFASADLARTLAGASKPLRYLDFETFMPAIPLFRGTRPFDAIPFQFSVHEQRGRRLTQHEYLHEQASDPREPLAVALLEALGDKGAICTWSAYERRVIGQLAADLPRLRKPLSALLARLWDLLPVVREHYYHPDFHGSFSIKSVLPVLVPDLGYDDLAIADGGMAAVAYVQALRTEDATERARTFADLRAYCARDTLAMVRLRAALLA